MKKEKIFTIIRDVFAAPDLSLSETTKAADVEGWDSFNHMNLIMRIEEEFNISFHTDEIGRMGNVGELIAAVIKKTG
jgi:acyl carrier protein